jgi:hypothetical protein
MEGITMQAGEYRKPGLIMKKYLEQRAEPCIARGMSPFIGFMK